MADQIKGLKELNRLLSELPDRAATRAVASGMKAGGEVIAESAREGLPEHYKSLRKSVKVQILRKRTPGKRLASITPVAPLGWYAHIVEYGTLGSRTKPLAPSTKRKREYDPMPVGLKPIPFMRNALPGKVDKVVAAFSIETGASIEREAKKLLK